MGFAETVESTALEVLRALKAHRALQTNVEFYAALLLEAVGFPPEAFTGVFAAGRMAGWLAHAREQAMIGLSSGRNRIMSGHGSTWPPEAQGYLPQGYLANVTTRTSR